MRLLVFSAGLALSLVATESRASAFTASLHWCSKTPHSTVSPAFTLSGAPKGTVSLSLEMTDHQSSYHHGGGTVRYEGEHIDCGAIASGWVGPFPPDGEVHVYEFTIKALDAGGKVLGVAHATRKFPE
jgi:phosphatidylethanolamine-binding protein (PEBP) family uncharacterized protein